MPTIGLGSAPAASSSGSYGVDSASAYVDALGAASAYDQEFNRTTNPTTLPGVWVAQNGNAYTYVEQLGMGKVLMASGLASLSISCFVQPVSAAASYTAVGKARTHYSLTGGRRGVSTGLVLTDGTKAIGVHFLTNPNIFVSRWNNMGSYLDNPGIAVCTDPEIEAMQTVGIYWRIKKNSGTSYDFSYSTDGMIWIAVLAAYDPSAFITPTHFGFLFDQVPTAASEATFDWFRVR